MCITNDPTNVYADVSVNPDDYGTMSVFNSEIKIQLLIM